MKPVVYSTYGKKFDFELNRNCEIYIDVFPMLPRGKNIDLRVFIAMEPDVISKLSSEVIRRQYEFDYILTFDENILSNCSNSILFEFGTTWIYIDKYQILEKKFGISMVCGHKETTKNHTLRKKIWYKQNSIKKPIDFFISMHGGVENINNNKILGDSKFPLFDSMFHICIENINQKYYFSEKLIDCLLCKSVPVYIGCQNIQDYFNPKGFIIVNNFNELISVCNNLTENDFYSRKEFIEENYNAALKWIDYDVRVQNTLNQIIKKNDFNFISNL